MAARCPDDTSQLLARVAKGDSLATDQLLDRHRGRLVAMIKLRMDGRLTARFDPSDVVQDSLTEAHGKLTNYARSQPIPFYPWLRGIAWQRLIQLQRQHLYAKRRSVSREEHSHQLADKSAELLAERLPMPATHASGHAIRKEIQARVHAAIQQLPEISREIIILRHLEEMSFNEITDVLKMSEDAIYSRYRRAIEKLSRSLAKHDD
ncbi:sigma-70 family RNA polymerase sigma factor [Bythopirellula goksoeyrii]|uniref:RNA polymerase sigma factor CnrH n=1 Tax=Bythopirellula goksoeyrii TaxID=1400387 RepID=A0A5B9QFG5_9BACT|nr:sigma-70 family RNA polymerase sigma factor [Bythopirellula goksoeyrii]QEG33071.1 RNA polymerase sigma factor CnrH [Bythopirellula goksoeyrii]